MRAGVIAFILIACAVMATVAIHNEPPKTTILVDGLIVEFPQSLDKAKLVSPLWPPVEYQGSNAALVIFAGADAVQSLCTGIAPLKQGQRFLGCMANKDGTPIIVVPNPCLMPETDFYAGIVCHELAHENGWRHG